MRILHVTDGYRPRVGGIEVFVQDLAERQARAGHEVTVLTATGAPDGTGLDGAGPDGAGPGDPVRVVRSRPGLWHPLAPRAARETALAGAYDVVHAHLSVVSPFATTVARATDEAGIATVLTVHSMWRSRSRAVRAVRSLAGWDASSAGWTTVSRAAAADMEQVLLPGTEVRVVTNAVDVDWWRAAPRPPARSGPVTVVSVMRLAGRKRPSALLDMLESVVREVGSTVPVRAVVVGDGPLEARLRADVARRGLTSSVHLVGRRSRTEIRALYAESDLYVAPAYQESFGIAALEARAAGLPVVAMESGGVGEFVEHGVEGMLCGDDADMVARIAALVADPVARSALSAYNLAHPPRHDWPGTLAGYDEVYRSVRERGVRQRREAAPDRLLPHGPEKVTPPRRPGGRTAAATAPTSPRSERSPTGRRRR